MSVGVLLNISAFLRRLCDYGVWKRADALHYTGNLYTKRGGALSEIWRPNMRGIE